MTGKEIRMVVQRLFKEGLIVPVYRAAGRRVSVDEMERRALVDPGFGGHLVSWFSSAGERLPDFITQPALVGAHQFLLEPGRPNADVKVALAYAINLPGSEPQRDLVRAILLCDGATLESTAALLQVDAEVVSLFEALHWNVLDRKRERHYVGRLCGQFRLGSTPGGVQACDADGLVLRRIAYELGSPEAVLAKAGVLPLNDRVRVQTLLQRLRSARLASAAQGVALEQISDKDNPDLKAVLRRIAARKKTDQEAGTLPTISADESVRMILEDLIRAGSTQTTKTKASS
jgi:hypothetical protein